MATTFQIVDNTMQLMNDAGTLVVTFVVVE